ncbi:MAG: hypothetical protein ACTS2F_25800 [Thainema sp.]
MGKEVYRLNKRRKTLEKLREYWEHQENILVVHYSCESFHDKSNDSTSRITSIAVRNFASGQTESFSIHKIAELEKLSSNQIVNNYDELERKMLDEFFQFLLENQRCTWVHWNMRDINYGFQALEHRYKVLGGLPTHLGEDRKLDLSRTLINIYGNNYIDHPRLGKLMEKNRISSISFLYGKDEAKAFEAREFVKLHQSTLRKVNVIASILERTLQDDLKTNAKWHQTHGIHPRALVEIITENWIWSLVTMTATIIGITKFFLM